MWSSEAGEDVKEENNESCPLKPQTLVSEVIAREAGRAPPKKRTQTLLDLPQENKGFYSQLQSETMIFLEPLCEATVPTPRHNPCCVVIPDRPRYVYTHLPGINKLHGPVTKVHFNFIRIVLLASCSELCLTEPFSVGTETSNSPL